MTYLSATDADGETKTCRQAHVDISAALTGFSAARFEFLGAKLNKPNAQQEVQAAMNYFFGVGRSAQDLMLNSLLARELEQARLDYQASAGNSARVTMLTQAVEQRRTQWTAEKTLFEEVAQPLMAYIEAFFYAVSPIMAFLFVLGPFGMKLFGRYLLLAAWIQLWIPIMALNNLYIHHGAMRNIQSLMGGGGADILSMVGLSSVWTEAASWLAVGGMMAAATPLLALMLLSGSYFAMTQLTNRMAGRDFTNERIMSPDLLQPPPTATAPGLLQADALANWNPTTGLTATGAHTAMGEIDLKSVASRSTSMAQGEMANKFDNWSSSIGTRVTDRAGESNAIEHAVRATEGISASNSETQSVVDAHTNDLMVRTGLDSKLHAENKESVASMIGVALTVGGEKMTPGLRGDLSKAITAATGMSTGEVDQVMEKIDQRLTDQHGFKTEMAEAISKDTVTGEMSRMERAFSGEDYKGLDTQRGEVQAATAAYQEEQRESLQYQSELEMSVPAFGEKHKHRDEEMYGLLVRRGLVGKAQEQAGQWTREIMDPEQRWMAAAGWTLSQGSEADRTALAQFMGFTPHDGWVQGEVAGMDRPDLQGPDITKQALDTQYEDEQLAARTRIGETDGQMQMHTAEGLADQAAFRQGALTDQQAAAVEEKKAFYDRNPQPETLETRLNDVEAVDAARPIAFGVATQVKAASAATQAWFMAFTDTHGAEGGGVQGITRGYLAAQAAASEGYGAAAAHAVATERMPHYEAAIREGHDPETAEWYAAQRTTYTLPYTEDQLSQSAGKTALERQETAREEHESRGQALEQRIGPDAMTLLRNASTGDPVRNRSELREAAAEASYFQRHAADGQSDTTAGHGGSNGGGAPGEVAGEAYRRGTGEMPGSMPQTHAEVFCQATGQGLEPASAVYETLATAQQGGQLEAAQSWARSQGYESDLQDARAAAVEVAGPEAVQQMDAARGWAPEQRQEAWSVSAAAAERATAAEPARSVGEGPGSAEVFTRATEQGLAPAAAVYETLAMGQQSGQLEAAQSWARSQGYESNLEDARAAAVEVAGPEAVQEMDVARRAAHGPPGGDARDPKSGLADPNGGAGSVAPGSAMAEAHEDASESTLPESAALYAAYEAAAADGQGAEWLLQQGHGSVASVRAAAEADVGPELLSRIEATGDLAADERAAELQSIGGAYRAQTGANETAPTAPGEGIGTDGANPIPSAGPTGSGNGGGARGDVAGEAFQSGTGSSPGATPQVPAMDEGGPTDGGDPPLAGDEPHVTGFDGDGLAPGGVAAQQVQGPENRVEATGASAAPQEIIVTPEERAENIYHEAVGNGVPPHTAWMVSRRGAGLETSGEEAERHREGMREELRGSDNGAAIAQSLVQHLEQRQENAAASAMDELAAAYRDSSAKDA